MREKQPFDLPRVAEFQPVEDGERQKQKKSSPNTSPEATQEPSEEAKLAEARMKAQEMWDSFRDVATAWRRFIIDHKSEIKEQKQSSGEGRFDVKNLFFDLENPLTQEFHKDQKYKRLQKQIGELYRDTAVKDAWQKGMTAHASQWEGVNGTWTEYLNLQKNERKLKDARDELLREKFEEQKLMPSKRRRTLATELTDGAIALEAVRIRKQEIAAQDPDLATKILARELEARRRELQSKEGFMWFPSRQRIRELVAEKIANRTTLRILNLEGEAGTGKTTLARAISRLFTGHEQLKIICGKKMKVDRALFADKELEMGSSPTVYRIVLSAVTGKERPDGPVHHDGRAVLLDELNTVENDETRVLVTNCDSMRPGDSTEYHLNGANPDDIVQPHALILAAQNLAGTKFSDRTVFTPEVKRKMDIIQVEYPPLTQDDPELYESFLVALMDADGRITASKEELVASWKADKIFEGEKQYNKEKYDYDDKAGGALWRFAKLLDASYKSFYGKANVLTDSNPDARLTGEPLTPGDVYAWLSEYHDARKRQQSLSSFLSDKYFTWIDQKFRAESDIGNRELYLKLGEHFGILIKEPTTGPHNALPKQKVTFDFLTQRDIAYLSPRVPRMKELIPPPEGGVPPSPEASTNWKSMTADLADDNGRTYEAIRMRIEDSNDNRRYLILSDPDSPVRIIGVIRECSEHPEFVGGHLYENWGGSERKGATLLFPDSFELLPPEKHIVHVESRKKDIINPFAEVLKENGMSGIEKLDQLEIDLGEILESCKETYRRHGLDTWANALPSSLADIVSGDPKQHKRFEAYLKEGRIPVFMPPASIQLQTLKDMLHTVSTNTHFNHFKPEVITGAAVTPAEDGYVGWDHFKNLMESKNPSLVTGVPNTAYIMWEKPTQKPESMNKNLPDQKKYIQDEQEKFKKAHNVTQSLIGGMMPAEYLALQIVFSDFVKAYAQRERVDIQTLNPLDNGTYTRFPGVEEAGGSVAVASWIAVDSHAQAGLARRGREWGWRCPSPGEGD